MFPYLSDLINYFLGTSVKLPFPMFGFMVALAYLAANVIFTREMMRKERLGLIGTSTKKVIIGEKAGIFDVLLNAFFGFLVGFKLLEAVNHYGELVVDPPGFILSSRGNLLGGIIGAIVLGGYHYYQKNKEALDSPKEVEQVVRPHDHVGAYTIIAAVVGLAGAKLFDAVEDIEAFMKNPIDVLFSGGGLSIYGGIVVAGIGVVYYSYVKKLPILHVLDALVPGLMLAYGIGRVGCQLSGDGDWGMPNDLPKPDWMSFLPDWMWSFDYPGNVLGINLKEDFMKMGLESVTGNAWPTPFYETIMAVVAFIILWQLRKRLRVAGILSGVYLIMNGISRFFIEEIRINRLYEFAGMSFTQAQFIAIGLILLGIIGIVYFTKNKERFPA